MRNTVDQGPVTAVIKDPEGKIECVYPNFVHLIDPDRELSYYRYSIDGKLDKAIDEANSKGWTVVDMEKD